MSKKDKKKKKNKDKLRKDKPRTRPRLEMQSDKRTAEFLVRRLGEIQDELADLLPDFRSMNRFDEVLYLGFILSSVQSLSKKCRKLAEQGTWEE